MRTQRISSNGTASRIVEIKTVENDYHRKLVQEVFKAVQQATPADRHTMPTHKTPEYVLAMTLRPRTTPSSSSSFAVAADRAVSVNTWKPVAHQQVGGPVIIKKLTMHGLGRGTSGPRGVHGVPGAGMGDQSLIFLLLVCQILLERKNHAHNHLVMVLQRPGRSWQFSQLFLCIHEHKNTRWFMHCFRVTFVTFPRVVAKETSVVTTKLHRVRASRGR